MSTKPNDHDHDFEELRAIYAHTDAPTTVAARTSPAQSANDVNHDDPSSGGQLMSQSANGRSSKYERVNRDGSLTATHVY